MKEIKFGRKQTDKDLDTASRTKTKAPKRRKSKPRKGSAALLSSSPKSSSRIAHAARDSRIESGQRHGALRVLPARRNVDGRLHFHAKCDCGQKIWTDYEGLELRSRKEAGCLTTGCPYTPFEIRAWYDWNTATRVQWLQMVNRFSEATDNDWGGRLLDGIEPAHDGYSRFCEWLGAQEGVSRGHWWVRRIDSIAPWADWNVTVEDKPDPELFAGGKMVINYYGAALTAAEWAQILGMDPDVVAALFRTSSADDLINNSIQETSST